MWYHDNEIWLFNQKAWNYIREFEFETKIDLTDKISEAKDIKEIKAHQGHIAYATLLHRDDTEQMKNKTKVQEKIQTYKSVDTSGHTTCDEILVCRKPNDGMRQICFWTNSDK